MGLRLLLVGMVMSLGVDPPVRCDLNAWTRYGQTWLWTTMDQWNTWTPLDDEEMCLADCGEGSSCPKVETTVKPVTTGAAQASSSEPAPTPAKNTEAASDEAFAAIVEDMVETFAMCDYDDEPSPAPAADTVLTASSDPATSAAPATVAAAASTAQPAAPEAPVTCTKDEPKAVASAPEAAWPWSVEFAGLHETCCHPAVVTMNAPASILPHAGTPTVIVAVEDVEIAAPAPTFDPYEVNDDPFVGVAYELNRESMVSLPAEEPAAPAIEAPAVDAALLAEGTASSVQGQRLATAVRLTGEAVHAWASLLRGPAVVSIRP